MRINEFNPFSAGNAGITIDYSTLKVSLAELDAGTLDGKAISISSLANGDVLQYNGTEWVNAAISAGAVDSVSNSDGTLTISPTTGNVVASLNLGHANTWSAEQTFTGFINGGGSGTSAPNGNTQFALWNGYSDMIGAGQWMAFMRDNGAYFMPIIGEQNAAFIIGFANDSSSAYSGLNANAGTMAFQITPDGAVYTGSNQNYAVPVPSGTSHGITIRNTLDDGSGNMTIKGLQGLILDGGSTSNGSISFIAGNQGIAGLASGAWGGIAQPTKAGEVDFLSSGSGTSPLTSLSIYGYEVFTHNNTLDDGSGNLIAAGHIYAGSSGGGVLFSGTSAVNGSGSGGASFSGRPRIGDWGQWLTIGEPNGTNNGNVIQITSGGIFTGHSSGITDTVSVRNTLDNGSGEIFLSNYVTGLFNKGTMGISSLNSGSTFTNNTPYTVIMIGWVSNGGLTGAPGSSSGFVSLNGGSFGTLASGGTITYNSEAMNWLWIVT